MPNPPQPGSPRTLSSVSHPGPFSDTQPILSSLENTLLPLTHGTTIAQPHSDALTTSSLGDLRFTDFGVYRFDEVSGLPVYEYFNKEVEMAKNLKQQIQHGHALMTRTYTYRSILRTLPQLSSTDDVAKKNAIYASTYEILKPEITKMKQLMYFKDSTIQVFINSLGAILPYFSKRSNNNMGNLQADFDFFPSDDLMELVVGFLDMVLMMDFMKNTKVSLNNDLSAYKRAAQLHSKNVQLEDESVEIQKLYFFLGTPDQFTYELKLALESSPLTTPGYDGVLIDVILYAVKMIETEAFLVPQTKFAYLKAIALALALIDIPEAKQDTKKRQKLEKKYDRITKVLRANPVVPLFGDLPIVLTKVYSKAKFLPQEIFFKPKEAVTTNEDSVSPQQSQQHHLHHSVKHAPSLIDDLKSVMNEYQTRYRHILVMFNGLKPSLKAPQGLTLEQNKLIYDTVLEAIQLLAKWTTTLLEFHAWKVANPIHLSNNNPGNESIPEDAIHYELALRYNYSEQERLALVKYMTIVKSAAQFLNELDRGFLEAIHRHTYTVFQRFSKESVTDLYNNANKNRRPIATILRHIKEITLDISRGFENPSTKNRSVVPSLAQIHLLRSLLNFGYNKKSRGMVGGMFRSKDFKDSEVAAMEEFHTMLGFLPFLMDVSGTARKLADLSNFWFREFFLELAKRVQFPIAMSMPWILTDTILETESPDLIQYFLYPMDIYNDAANMALHELKCRYIYDEIEAETSLAVDQMVFKISQSVYAQYKAQAAKLSLDAEVKNIILAQGSNMLELRDNEPPFNWLDIVMKQKSVQILGRTLNLVKLISQAMNELLRKNVNYCIAKYESAPLTSLVDLESLMNVCRTTHALLSEHLILDPWEDIVADVDEQLNLTGYNGRIVTHTIVELIDDFIPNYCYNSLTGKFTRSPASFVAVTARSKPPKSSALLGYGSKDMNGFYAFKESMYSSFVDSTHFEALVKCIGPAALTTIFGELRGQLKSMVSKVFQVYIAWYHSNAEELVALTASPLGIVGMYDLYCSKLTPLLEWPEFKSEALQSFREIGNLFLLLRKLDAAMKVENVFYETQVASIQRGKDSTDSITTLVNDFDGKLTITPISESNISYAKWSKEIETLYSKPNTPDLCSMAFITTHDALKDVCLELNSTGEDLLANPFAFFRIFSATCFVAACLGVNSDVSPRELYGEGFQWGGCLILHVLGQSMYFRSLDFINHLRFDEVEKERKDKDKKGKSLSSTFSSANNNHGQHELSDAELKKREVAKFVELGKHSFSLCEEILDLLSVEMSSLSAI